MYGCEKIAAMFACDFVESIYAAPDDVCDRRLRDEVERRRDIFPGVPEEATAAERVDEVAVLVDLGDDLLFVCEEGRIRLVEAVK